MDVANKEANVVYSLRNGHVESTHNYRFSVIKDGKIVQEGGDINGLVSLRSTSKPLALKYMISERERKEKNLSDKMLAVMMSSHNGEAQHRQLLKTIIDLYGLNIKDISCGLQTPYYGEVFKDYYLENDFYEKQLYHNCSGKHVAMLIWCKNNNVDTEGYWKETHPLQKHLSESLENDLKGISGESLKHGVDGCGVPCYFMSLYAMSMLYYRLAVSDDYKYIRNAMLKEPFYLAGSLRRETDVSNDCGIIMKCGAEGAYGVALPEQRIGIALKAESGSKEAAEVALAKVLLGLDGIDAETKKKLEKYKTSKIISSTGIEVGMIV